METRLADYRAVAYLSGTNASCRHRERPVGIRLSGFRTLGPDEGGIGLIPLRSVGSLPGMTVSVVIPFFNEEENVSALLAEIRRAVPGAEIVAVDDASRDGTLAVLKREPGVTTYTYPKNLGQSAALYLGLTRATGDVLVMMDGDGQNDPADIPALLAAMKTESADAAFGYRKKRMDSLSKENHLAPRQRYPALDARRRPDRHRLLAQGDPARTRPVSHPVQRHAPLLRRVLRARRIESRPSAGEPPPARPRRFEVHESRARLARPARPRRGLMAHGPAHPLGSCHGGRASWVVR